VLDELEETPEPKRTDCLQFLDRPLRRQRDNLDRRRPAALPGLAPTRALGISTLGIGTLGIRALEGGTRGQPLVHKRRARRRPPLHEVGD
jgi:hypothetical protein